MSRNPALRPLIPFAACLRAERARAGLTQAELGDRAGLTAHSIGNYERGISTPNLDTLVRLAAALGVDPVVLVPSLESCAAA